MLDALRSGTSRTRIGTGRKLSAIIYRDRRDRRGLAIVKPKHNGEYSSPWVASKKKKKKRTTVLLRKREDFMTARTYRSYHHRCISFSVAVSW